MGVNISADSTRKIQCETSQHEYIQGINANDDVKEGMPSEVVFTRWVNIMDINHGWSGLIWLVAQDILNLRNRPGRLQYLRPSREDSDTLLCRIEHRLYAWQDASNVRCDERIVRVQHSGSTL
jgi:hypothetical protein